MDGDRLSGTPADPRSSSARDAIVSAATRQLALASPSGPTVAMATSTALLVIVAWVAVPLRAAGWWTARSDA